VRVHVLLRLACVLSVAVAGTLATVVQAAGSICNSAPLTFSRADFVDAKGKPIAGTNLYFPLRPSSEGLP